MHTEKGAAPGDDGPYSGKSRTFVKILYSSVRSLYGFVRMRNSVSDWDCVDCDVWNGI